MCLIENNFTAKFLLKYVGLVSNTISPHGSQINPQYFSILVIQVLSANYLLAKTNIQPYNLP